MKTQSVQVSLTNPMPNRHVKAITAADLPTYVIWVSSRYETAEHKTHNSTHKSQTQVISKLLCEPSPLLFIIIIDIIIIIIKMNRLKWRLTLKSNQPNDDWYSNVFKRRRKVSRDGISDTSWETVPCTWCRHRKRTDHALDQTGKTT